MPEALRPGRDCWRVERAERAKVLIDAEEYFCALRAALLNAEHSIRIVGWDIDRRMPFPGCAEDVARLESLTQADGHEIAADGYPLRLGDFLAELVKRKPNLWIRILLWDFSLLYAAGRELRPAMALALRWKTPRRLDLCLDDEIPMGASHHQKLIVIDDAVAFCGGMDLSCGRWDSCSHAADDKRRRLLDGAPYSPVHDVQVMVDGPAAQCIGDYVRARWARAAYEKLGRAAPRSAAQVWPRGFAPDFRDVSVALARTEPGFAGAPAVTEIERLFLRMIAEARRHIYIENQYLTLETVAEALVQALKAKPGLEAVIVSSSSYPSWVEDAAMIPGRHRFMQLVEAAGVGDRILFLAPSNGATERAAEIKVHAKVMIVDDRFLRIGSANLCRRSMGVDTEFDLTLLGESERSRKAIIDIRNKLVAEHCGTEAAAVAAALAETGSLRATIARLNGGATRRLVPIAPAEHPESVPEALAAIADPEKPIDPTLALAGFAPRAGEDGGKRRRKAPWVWLGLVALVMMGLAALWTLTPLSAMAEVENWERMLAAIRGPWEILAVLVVFVLSGLVAFPVIVLIAGTTAVFGVWPGMLYAGLGAMASALATYGIGWYLGQRRLRRYFGPRVNRIKQSFAGRGIVTVTAIRLIPAAPYTLVNLAAGALKIPPLEYAVGTALGLAPGILVMSLLGSTIVGIIAHPTWGGIALIAGLLVGAILLSLGVQLVVRRLHRLF
jgi:phosphatidylserine/phosphatidylglycerophosphate/cardiolipin synthase-like enzyme/membrane protein DedA with SNARE-associated domain